MNLFSFRRTVSLTAALSILSLGLGSPDAYSQASEGSIYGKVAAGASVTIKSEDTGASRTLTADANGNFSASRVAPGKYTVTAGDKSTLITVSIGSATRVDQEQLLATVEVLANAIKSIDFKTTESNFVIDQETIQALPVALNVNTVAALSPTVIRGDAGLGSGNVPSFAGASVAENAYYINGFDVTNIRNFLSYADLPFEAIAQQQVKAGGYGAEYGRSLGGVVSLVTRRGTNEFKGGLSLSYSSSELSGKGHDVLNKEPELSSNYWAFQRASKRENALLTAHLGGPLIQDRLFFFAMVEQPMAENSSFGRTSSTKSKSDTPTGLLKLDWQINDSNVFELTGIWNKTRTDLDDYTNPTGQNYLTTHSGAAKKSWYYSGAWTGIAKYTGYITDNLTVSLGGGKVSDLVGDIKGSRTASLQCIAVYDVDLTPLGCWNENALTGRDPFAPDDRDERVAGRFDVEYKLGDHTIRGGVDYQNFESVAAGSSYSGGTYYRYFRTGAAGGTVNGVRVAPNTTYVRQRFYNTTSGAFEVINNALYLEDTWQVNERLMVYGGLRSETFDNRNADGVSFVKKENLIAPRLGFSLDMDTEQPTKVFASAGRYYIPVASNTNIRATRAELFTNDFFLFTSRNSNGIPSGLTRLGSTVFLSSGETPDPAIIADANLDPMNQDEFILGAQRTFDNDWTIGLKAIYRKLNSGMDDFCDHTALDRWVAETKQPFAATFDSYQFACALINPGKDVTLSLDVKGDGNRALYTVPAKYFGLDAYEREYKGIELTFERPWDGRWSVRGSYVLSKSEGSGEGYVSSTINQEDAGITQDFDFGSFDDGAYGPLPNDRRHVLKFFGNYGVTPELTAGFLVSVLSGRPKSCIGFVPSTVYDYAGSGSYTTASTYYCLNDQGKTVLTQRGSEGRTPWTQQIDLQLAYAPKNLTSKGALRFQLDVFNVLNSQKPIEQNEVRDYSRQTSGAATGNRISLNYGLPLAWQAPRSARLTVRYEF